MLSELFYWVLNMSIFGAVTGCLILLLRKIKQIPRGVVYFLWCVPLIRFWIPIAFQYRYSFASLLKQLTTTVVVHEFVVFPNLAFMNSVQAAEKYFPIEYKTNFLGQVFSVASIIWAVGAAAALLTALVLYWLTKSELKSAKPIGDDVWTSDKILSPVAIGIFNPKIVIPAYMENHDLQYILAHEKAHIKRADNLWRMMAVITCCLHWFNPLIWLFLKCFFEELELSCDEKVLQQYGGEKKKEYAAALLECEQQKAVFVSSFGGAKIRVRIERILSYKKLTAISALYLGLLIAIVVITLLTNAG